MFDAIVREKDLPDYGLKKGDVKHKQAA